MARLKRLGYPAAIAERRLSHAGTHGRTVDLFGVFDIMAIASGQIWGIQVCGRDFAAHDRKIRRSCEALAWLRAGGSVQLWGWRRRKHGRCVRWRERIKIYEPSDFDEEE